MPNFSHFWSILLLSGSLHAAVGTFTQAGRTYYDTPYGRALARARQLEDQAQSAQVRVQKARQALAQNMNDLSRLIQQGLNKDLEMIKQIQRLAEQAEQTYHTTTGDAYTTNGNRTKVLEGIRDYADFFRKLGQEVKRYKNQAVLKATVEVLEKLEPEIEKNKTNLEKRASAVEKTIQSPKSTFWEYIDSTVGDSQDLKDKLLQHSGLSASELQNALAPIDQSLASKTTINSTNEFKQVEQATKQLAATELEQRVVDKTRLLEAAIYFAIVEGSEKWADQGKATGTAMAQDLVTYLKEKTAASPSIPASQPASSLDTQSPTSKPKPVQKRISKPVKSRGELE